jgi:SAM-dependent methyltransferase
MAVRQDGRAQRERMQAQWAAVAPGWAENAEHVDELLAPTTERLLALSDPRSGDRVLELACGPGGAGLAAARRVGPAGAAMLTDAVPEMTAIAAARARALGLGNVSTRVLDLDRIDLPDGSYDVAICREGFMLALDPAGAAREVRRVLRPGGRMAVSVWGARERNPWLGAMLDAVGAQLGRRVPPPGVPHPFSLSDPERLAGLLSGAGLADVTVTELPLTMREASVDAWWERRAALAGPLASVLATLPEDAVRALRARASAAVREYVSDGGVELPALVLVAGGRRP